jgi:DNA sulfur modification protein DndC
LLVIGSRIVDSLGVLDKALGNREKVVIAYSGGKDSTALALLVLDWIVSRKRSLNVTLLHGDTLSEIFEMEHWARGFAETYIEMLSEHGSDGEIVVARPEPWESFYWRVFVRGYPASTFSWRWCVDLLKRKPGNRILREISRDAIMLLGHRDSESSARARALNSRTGSCSLSPGSCYSYYLSLDGDIEKIYPIRSWDDRDVWSYLRAWRNRLGILDNLFRLYGYGLVKARYGCWHCTLVKIQLGHEILGGGYMYFEAVRKIYRAVSDIPEMRAAKDSGYSRHGFLLAPARSLILNSMLVAEKLSGIRLYGLDESRIDGHSLREIFVEMPSQEANKIVEKVEKENKGDLRRVMSIEELRDIDRHRKDLEKIWEHRLVKNDKHIKEIIDLVV